MANSPKILFLNINFRYDNSAGITIYKLFNFFPRHKLGLLSIYSDISDIDIFGYKYQITNTESKKKIKVVNNPRKNKNELHPHKKFEILVKPVKTIIKSLIGKNIIENRYQISDKLKKWLIQFSPDYLYINPVKTETIKFAQEISKLIGCKIIIHVMDDKVNANYQGILGFINKRKFNKNFVKIVKNSDIRLSISEKMANVYYKRYKIKFHAFHNPIDTQKWLLYKKENWKLNKEIKVLYSGFIGYTSTPIFEFCKSIEKLNLIGYNIKLILYSKFSSYKIINKLKNYSFVEINDYVEQKNLPETLSKADFLFLPLSFKKRDRFTALSMPTKTAEYMISSVPIIVYSPAETALAEYANKYRWAFLITSNDIKKITNALNQLINNKDLREELAENAVACAKEKHDMKVNQFKIRQIINKQRPVNNNLEITTNL